MWSFDLWKQKAQLRGNKNSPLVSHVSVLCIQTNYCDRSQECPSIVYSFRSLCHLHTTAFTIRHMHSICPALPIQLYRQLSISWFFFFAAEQSNWVCTYHRKKVVWTQMTFRLKAFFRVPILSCKERNAPIQNVQKKKNRHRPKRRTTMTADNGLFSRYLYTLLEEKTNRRGLGRDQTLSSARYCQLSLVPSEASPNPCSRTLFFRGGSGHFMLCSILVMINVF